MIPENYPSVSRETIAKLEIYQRLLQKWQAKINLVSSDTLSESWERHFLDSLQILKFLDQDGPRTLVDFGSGAGFPGLVLAIAHPNLTVHLAESDMKKVEFMKAVSRETGTQVTFHNVRIENLEAFHADYITARALAPLKELLNYTKPFQQYNPAAQMIFLKGEHWGDEISEARSYYDFSIQDYPSLTSAKARVLVIRDVVVRL